MAASETIATKLSRIFCERPGEAFRLSEMPPSERMAEAQKLLGVQEIPHGYWSDTILYTIDDFAEAQGKGE